MSGLVMPEYFNQPEQREDGMERFLFPDGVDIVSLKMENGEGAYVVHRDWRCGAVSPDESRAAKDLCNAAEEVAVGKMSVEKFMDKFYPEEEYSYTRQLFFEKKILKKRADGKLEMNIQFK
jgi:hypothetical protein